MIEAKEIYKSYETVEVLKGISLKIEAGEVLSITGDSGAGKSTLLHLLSSLDQPTSGEIWFENELISSLKPNKLADFRNHQVGFIFQFHQCKKLCRSIWNNNSLKKITCPSCCKN